MATVSNSSSSILQRIDSDTRDIINYLKNRDEICDLYIDEITSANKIQISEWEIKYMCSLPSDLKAFYMNHNGILIEWKCKIDKETVLPLGRIQVNGLKELTRVGSALSKEFSEPSLFDLDDIRDLSESSTQSNDEESDNNSVQSDRDEPVTIKNKKAAIPPPPHFDERSRNFELDNCNGYGKICLVYGNNPGQDELEPTVWYLDRSLTWHFLATSFTNYYRLLIAHLGLPQWPMLFTPYGLPPSLMQWYYMFAPGRILIQQSNMEKNFDVLKLVETTATTSGKSGNTAATPTNKKPQAISSQSSSTTSTEVKGKIDFSLFDDKQLKAAKNVDKSTTNQNQDNRYSNSQSRSRSNPIKK